MDGKFTVRSYFKTLVINTENIFSDKEVHAPRPSFFMLEI